MDLGEAIRRSVPETLAAYVVGVDHVALAVPDLEASLRFDTGLLGFRKVAERETRGERTGMRSAVVQAGDRTLVLVMGTEPENQVSRFVERCGPGVQHVALRVTCLEQAMAGLTARGVRFDTDLIEGPFTRQVFLPATRPRACASSSSSGAATGSAMAPCSSCSARWRPGISGDRRAR